MANKGHFDQIQKGAAAWNEWRRTAPDERPDLSGAALSFGKLAGCDFSEANLWEANLKKANLVGADFKGAELSFADLSGADLSGADLSGANLTEVDFSGATLRGAVIKSANGWGGLFKGADLTDADLTGADFSDADLTCSRFERTRLVGVVLGKADLTGAVMSGTVISRVDMRRVRGLESVVHESPSLVGADLLEQRAPLTFLQNAGVSSTLLSSLSKDVDEPISTSETFANGPVVRSLLLDKSGGSRFPDRVYTIVTENQCRFYKAADRFQLTGAGLSLPPEKPACLILMADILGLVRQGDDSKKQGTTFRCGGCVGRVRLAQGDADNLPGEGKLSREMEAMIKLLKGFDMFKRLASKDIQYCLAYLRLGKYKEGDMLMRKGEIGGHLHIVLSGRVEVLGEGGVSIAFMGQGEVFGEMSLLSGRAVGADIRVVKPSRILYLQASDFRHLLVKFPPLQLYFNRLLVERLSEIHDERSRELASGVVGQLSDMPPAELLQTLNINQKTGVLRLKTSSASASVSFRDGAMVDAKYDHLSGKDAFYQILVETEGRFKFVPGLSDEAMAAEDMGDFMGLLMEGLRRIDESGDA